MTATLTRAQMRPGQIVQRVTTYRVLPATWAEGSKHAGLHKLDQLLPDRDEWQLIRGRWRVRWNPALRFPGTHLAGFWIAEEQDRRDAYGDTDWAIFVTHAEAIAYADRQARRPL